VGQDRKTDCTGGEPAERRASGNIVHLVSPSIASAIRPRSRRLSSAASLRPNGRPIQILGGFLHGKEVYGRPVGVAIDRAGALLVADDAGNTIWRVTAISPPPRRGRT